MINMPENVRLFRAVGDTNVHVSKPNETMSWFNECGAEYIRADLVPQWQPIETYDGKDFFVLISDGKYWTLGVKRKYWHDTSEGDYLVTSPMADQPRYWMPNITPPPAT